MINNVTEVHIGMGTVDITPFTGDTAANTKVFGLTFEAGGTVAAITIHDAPAYELLLKKLGEAYEMYKQDHTQYLYNMSEPELDEFLDDKDLLTLSKEEKLAIAVEQVKNDYDKPLSRLRTRTEDDKAQI